MHAHARARAHTHTQHTGDAAPERDSDDEVVDDAAALLNLAVVALHGDMAQVCV
jgi:hypothetical protein